MIKQGYNTFLQTTPIFLLNFFFINNSLAFLVFFLQKGANLCICFNAKKKQAKLSAQNISVRHFILKKTKIFIIFTIYSRVSTFYLCFFFHIRKNLHTNTNKTKKRIGHISCISYCSLFRKHGILYRIPEFFFRILIGIIPVSMSSLILSPPLLLLLLL